MKDNSFAFIACVNDETAYKQCLTHLKSLIVPRGYKVEFLSYRNQESMAHGYNKAIKNSSAKYKIYLHQDTLIINNNFLFDILNIFIHHQTIGLIGVIGCEQLTSNGIWWESEKCIGKVMENRNIYKTLDFGTITGELVVAEAVDGLIMITQYDVPWREDIFNGWHYYDISQCFEFKKFGYQIAIPNQKDPWCIHMCGETINTSKYSHYQKKFINQYITKEKH
ncbi:MAG: glycosyltransferase [Bacteroidetes bacterium]|nr:glycosyltransferase [Bacteroidota bacterium]